MRTKVAADPLETLSVRLQLLRAVTIAKLPHVFQVDSSVLQGQASRLFNQVERIYLLF